MQADEYRGSVGEFGSPLACFDAANAAHHRGSGEASVERGWRHPCDMIEAAAAL